MHSWITTCLFLVAGLAMLALSVGACFGRAIVNAATRLRATLPTHVLVVLIAMSGVCAVKADKNRGGNGNDGRAERVDRVEERDEGWMMGDENRVERVERVEEQDSDGTSPSLPTQTSKPLNTQTLPMRSGGQGYSVTTNDLARGWRVESVTTNATFGYQGEYSNVVEKVEWHIRGGSDIRFAVDLGGFVFPLGTNEISRVCVLSGGTIWTLPPIAPRETICAAQEWASFQPGTSHFWSADADNGAKLLTWENVYANRDGTGPFSAQIELHESGDFVLRRDNVETVCRRINPDDWDGDGLANDLDANPLTWDGDYLGPSNELPANANSNAYCTVSIRVAGPHAEVVFIGDGPSNYPDPHFVAHGGVVYDVTILKGKAYSISCRQPVNVVGSSDSETENWTDNDSGLLCVRRPVTATATSLAYFGDAESKRMFSMSVSPNYLDGVFDWTNSCGQISVYSSDIFRYAPCQGCTCGGCVATGRYVYEGYGLGVVGGLCPSAFLGEEPQVEASVDPSPSVSAAFSQSAVIYENAYENTPGQWVGRRSTRTRLDICANGGLRGGTLSVTATNLVKLSKILGAAPPTASVSVPPGEMVTYSAVYEAMDHSAEPDDISVAATFTENDTGTLISSTNVLGSFAEPPTTQRFSLRADGTFSIRKYKYEASRTLNGVPTYREVGQ